MIPPKLDYIHQYPVVGVEDFDDSWVIVFESNIRVYIEDKKCKKDESIVGKSLLTTMKTATATSMRFGNVINGEIVNDTIITFDPMLYAIEDHRVGGEKVYPQHPVEKADVVDPEILATMAARTAQHQPNGKRKVDA